MTLALNKSGGKFEVAEVGDVERTVDFNTLFIIITQQFPFMEYAGDLS